MNETNLKDELLYLAFYGLETKEVEDRIDEINYILNKSRGDVKMNESVKEVKLEVAERVLESVVTELQKRFDNWKSSVDNGCNPVSIQDIDYWKNQLQKSIKLIQGDD